MCSPCSRCSWVYKGAGDPPIDLKKSHIEAIRRAEPIGLQGREVGRFASARVPPHLTALQSHLLRRASPSLRPRCNDWKPFNTHGELVRGKDPTSDQDLSNSGNPGDFPRFPDWRVPTFFTFVLMDGGDRGSSSLAAAYVPLAGYG